MFFHCLNRAVLVARAQRIVYVAGNAAIMRLSTVHILLSSKRQKYSRMIRPLQLRAYNLELLDTVSTR